MDIDRIQLEVDKIRYRYIDKDIDIIKIEFTSKASVRGVKPVLIAEALLACITEGEEKTENVEEE